MNLEIQILMASAGAVALSLFFLLILFRKHRKNRELVEFIEKQVVDLQDTLAKNKEVFDSNAHRMAEQARRLAWLETRVRQPKLITDEVVNDSAIQETPKLNITERRHRVIKLASRGQNVEMIATALGMLPGEVDLILNLSKAAAAVAGSK